MTQSQLKLTYFDAAGLGELPRLLFAAGGIAFEDDRIQREDFAAIKPTMPLGKIPVLTLDGTMYPQSMAIARYAAREAGLEPTSSLDALKVDVILETLGEVILALVGIINAKDEEEKAEKVKELVNTQAPKFLGLIETRTQGKFVLGDRMSMADVQLFNVVDTFLIPMCAGFNVSSYPKVESVIANVKANANIAAYLAKRA